MSLANQLPWDASQRSEKRLVSSPYCLVMVAIHQFKRPEPTITNEQDTRVMEECMDDRPIDREKLRAAIRRMGGEYIFYMLDDAITLLPEAKLRNLIENYLDAAGLCSYGRRNRTCSPMRKRFKKRACLAATTMGPPVMARIARETPSKRWLGYAPTASRSFLSSRSMPFFPKAGLNASGSRKMSISSENLWIRFQPFDRLVPPVKITLSPAVTEMIPSVVSQADRLLFRTALARVTFSRMSVALAVQMKGLGF